MITFAYSIKYQSDFTSDNDASLSSLMTTQATVDASAINAIKYVKVLDASDADDLKDLKALRNMINCNEVARKVEDFEIISKSCDI